MPVKKVVKKTMSKKGTASPKRDVKKTKRSKTEGGPKRPTSAFMYFSIQRRAEIVKDDPSLRTNIGGVAKKIGEEWREMGPSQKQKFEVMAAKDRQRYENEKIKS